MFLHKKGFITVGVKTMYDKILMGIYYKAHPCSVKDRTVSAVLPLYKIRAASGIFCLRNNNLNKYLLKDLIQSTGFFLEKVKQV